MSNEEEDIPNPGMKKTKKKTFLQNIASTNKIVVGCLFWALYEAFLYTEKKLDIWLYTIRDIFASQTWKTTKGCHPTWVWFLLRKEQVMQRLERE